MPLKRGKRGMLDLWFDNISWEHMYWLPRELGTQFYEIGNVAATCFLFQMPGASAVCEWHLPLLCTSENRSIQASKSWRGNTRERGPLSFLCIWINQNSQTDGLEVERHVLVKSQVSHAMLKDFLVRILWHYDGHVTNNTAIKNWDINSLNKLCMLLHFNLSSVRDCCISFHHRQPLELEELQTLKVTGW